MMMIMMMNNVFVDDMDDIDYDDDVSDAEMEYLNKLYE